MIGISKKRSVFVIIVMLVIGFAAVSTTLIINGVVGIGTNNNDFEVIFVEGLLNGEESSNIVIDETKKKLKFDTNKITKVGVPEEIQYSIKNNSTLYDADVTINCTMEENEYIEVSGSLDNKEMPITEKIRFAAQEVKSGKIIVKMKKSYPEETDMDWPINCTIQADAVGREEIAERIDDNSYKGPISGVEVGTYVAMTPDATSYSVLASDTGCADKKDACYEWIPDEENPDADPVFRSPTDQEIKPNELNIWRIIKKNDDGSVEAISEYTSSDYLYFYGVTGYAKYINTMKKIASSYKSKYTQATRIVGYKNQTPIITDTSKILSETKPWDYNNIDSPPEDEKLGAGDRGYEDDLNLIKNSLNTLVAKNVLTKKDSNYFVASRKYVSSLTTSSDGNNDHELRLFSIRHIESDLERLNSFQLIFFNFGNDNNLTYWSTSQFASNQRDSFLTYLRPIITFKPTVEVVSGTGLDEEHAYQISMGDISTVFFDGNEGISTLESKDIKIGDNYGELPTATRLGYNFAGWYTEKEAGERIEETSTFNFENAQTIYAHWTEATFNISFDTNGGDEITNKVVVTYNGTYGELPIPTKVNYTFLGWYTALENGDKIDSATSVTITSDQTLYAHWRRNEYKGAIKGVQLGDYIKMTPDSTSYSVLGEETGCIEGVINNGGSPYSETPACGGINGAPQTINPSELNLWRVIKINDDGSVDAISEYVSSNNIHLYGKTGYANSVGVLNKIASQYQSKYTLRARSFGYTNQTEYITDRSKIDSTTKPFLYGTGFQTTPINEPLGSGEKWYEEDEKLLDEVIGKTSALNVKTKETAYYWTASRWYEAFSDNWSFRVSAAFDGFIGPGSIYDYNPGSEHVEQWSAYPKIGIRPIVTFRPQVQVVSGTGMDEEHAFEISIDNKYVVSNITFDANGGNPVNEIQTVTYQSRYGELPTPTIDVEDTVFRGWFTEPEGGTQITQNSIVNITRDTVLYAHYAGPGEWQEIHYDAGMGTIDSNDSDEIIFVGDYPSFPYVEPPYGDVCTTYNFLYWTYNGSPVSEYVFEKQDPDNWERYVSFFAEFEMTSNGCDDPCMMDPSMCDPCIMDPASCY